MKIKMRDKLKEQPKLFYVGLVMTLCVVSLISLSVGSIFIAPQKILSALAVSLVGDEECIASHYSMVSSIVWHIRFPRLLAALLAGSALAVAGVVSQGVFRNALASPDILGVSAGSSLGAVVCIVMGGALIHPLAITLSAIIGALGIALVIFYLTRRFASEQPLYLILAGIALSSLMGGITMGVLLFAQEYQLSQFVFWSMGGLDGRLWQTVLWPAPWVVGVIIVTICYHRSLDALTLGDFAAHGTGLNVVKSKSQLLLLCALLTALAIAIAGPIGFVGLMIPHLVRMSIGPKHGHLLAVSALCGALFLVISDALGRTIIAPYEIKAGIICSVIGSGYFFFLIIRLRAHRQVI